MSKKKEYAIKFLVEAVGLNNLSVLDEILHPEYYAENHVTEKDRLWNRRTSFLGVISSRSENIEEFYDINQGMVMKTGIEAAKRRMDKTRISDYLIPNLQVQVHEIVEEGDNVIVMYTLSFIHDQRYYGIRPTNQEIRYNGVHSLTFNEDKIVKTTLLSDTYRLLAEMGETILRQGDEEQIKQYMAMLEIQNLIPRGMSEKHE